MDIGVVIVTYNRLEKLKNTLECYQRQIKKPKYIIVVNNASTDETAIFLNEWKNMIVDYEKIVISMKQNSGGSGGFYKGMEYAMTRTDADWIWISDDDAYPEEDNFSKIVEFENTHTKLMTSVVAMTAVVEGNNGIDYRHRRRVRKTFKSIYEDSVSPKEYDNEYFELDVFSYVGTLIRKDVLNKAGLPIKDFFIFYDDSEHSIRIKQYGKIICLTNLIVHHDINVTSSESVVTWKQYYGIRNYLYYLKISYSRKYYYKQIFYFIWCAIKKRLYYNEKTEKEIIIAAVKDAARGKLGLHNIYKPGWESTK